MIRRSNLSSSLGVVLAVIGLAFAPAPVYREPPAAKLLEAMQGSWDFVFPTRDQNGKVSTVTQRVELANKTWKSRYTTQGFHPDNQVYEMVLDGTKIPATLDLVSRGRDGPRVVMLGIVRRDRDALTYCYAMTWEEGAARPRSFDTNERLTNRKRPYTMTLKRPK